MYNLVDMNERSHHTLDTERPAASEVVREILRATRIAQVTSDRLEREEAKTTALTAGMEFWALPKDEQREGARLLRDIRDRDPKNPVLTQGIAALHDARELRQQLLQNTLS